MVKIRIKQCLLWIMLSTIMLLLTAIPVMASSEEGQENIIEIVAYVSESVNGNVIQLSDNVTLLEPNGLMGNISTNWQDATSGWVWTTSNKYYIDTNYRPLYSKYAGASININMGAVVAGKYDFYYYTVQAPNSGSSEMTWSVQEGEQASQTIYVPAQGALAAGSDIIAGWTKVGSVELTGSDDVIASYVVASGTTDARVTAIKLVLTEQAEEPIDNVIIRSAIVTEDCSYSPTEKWSRSNLANFDGNQTIYCNEKSSTLTFHVGEIESGNYEIYYWAVPHQYNLENMPLTVIHNNKNTTINVPMNNDAVSGWYYMGILDFNGTGTETIEFVHPGGGVQARGTAIKLVATEDEIDDSKAEEESSTDNGLIDVEPYPGFSFVGNWQQSSGLVGPMSKSPYSLWISQELINKAQEPYNQPANTYCQYRPDLQVTSEVRVAVYLLYHNTNQTDDVIYEVHHNGEVDTFHIDMTTLTADEWRVLGTFDFSGNEETNFVRIVCTDADNYGEKTNFRASTVKFDVLQEEGSSDVWQTVYVTPSPEAEIVTIAELDQFEDIPEGNPIKYDIEYMYNEGYITGITETLFAPNEYMSRSDFITYLSNILCLNTQDSSLMDSLLAGIDENEILTKEEVAQILHNAVKYLNKNVQWLHSLMPDYTTISDYDTVSDWAVNAIDTMYRCGVVTTTEGMLSPQKILTRSEAVIMLKQFMQQFVNSGPANDTGENWILTFNEEFQGDALDTNVWEAKTDMASGTRLSSRHPENIEVHDGAAHLVTKYESRQEGIEWTTGNIAADQGAFTQEYGYWEARYKFTASSGINNAFWMMTLGNWSNQWYEIDVCEGHYMNKINTNLHECATKGGVDKAQHSERYRALYDLSEDYHTYAVEWTPETIKYYFDGQLIHTKVNPTTNGKQAFPRLSTCVLPWAGAIDVDAHGTAMIVDYVRVYQRNGDIEGHTSATEHALDNLSSCVLEKIEAAQATDTQNGHVEHWKCTMCNKVFADANGIIEIDIDDIIIPAISAETNLSN